MWAMTQKLVLLLLFAAVVGCGGGDAFTDGAAIVGDNGAATITLLVSNPQLGSNPSDSVDVTAIVKDDSNNLISGAEVTFTASSGDLSIVNSVTGETGQATASLSTGSDASLRTITITASSGLASQTVEIEVIGTQLTIGGEDSLVFGDTATLAIFLKDSEGAALAGQTITVTSTLGNSLSSANSFVTDSAGSLRVSLTGDVAGSDTITATALGVTASFTVVVSSDQFQVTTETDIEIDTCSVITASWSSNGVAQVGQTVDFSVTRGTLYTDAACTTVGNTALTNGSGVATVYMTSSAAGPTVVTAEGVISSDTVTASKETEFVAVTPSTLVLQVDQTTIGPNETALFTATVRDANNNLVKNVPVRFSIVQDTTGGSIEAPPTDTTDSLGRASTIYTATDAASATNGVIIRAQVDDDNFPGISDQLALTVGQKALFISIGLANTLETETAASYALPGVVFVTDSGGNPIEAADVVLKTKVTFYDKGTRQFTGAWTAISSITTSAVTLNLSCANEDGLTGNPNYDFNGNLDPGEDFNNNGTLESENPTTVDKAAITNSSGFSEFRVRYPKDYASWTQVELTATASVAGTESSTTQEFILPVLSDDVKDADKSPPGPVSPFGFAASCAASG